jgi:hypothetical protein
MVFLLIGGRGVLCSGCLQPDLPSLARHRRARGNAINAAKKTAFAAGNRWGASPAATAIESAKKYLVLILVTAP